MAKEMGVNHRILTDEGIEDYRERGEIHPHQRMLSTTYEVRPMRVLFDFTGEHFEILR